MSDLRLKTLTVDKNTLIIQKGNIHITSTTPSINNTSAALLINGGVSINNATQALNSTSGGALTITGGLGVSKNTFLNGDLDLESPTNIFRVYGNSIDRVKIDSIVNKNIHFSTDGIDKKLDIYNDYISIPITTESINSTTGALLIDGGITIKNTNSSFYNSGNTNLQGTLNVNKNTTLNQNLIIDGNTISFQNTSGQYTLLQTDVTDFTITNAAGDINLISNTGGHININNNVYINEQYTEIYKEIVFYNTQESLSASDSSVVTYGGIGINVTNNATSITSGGALTIAGGMSVEKDVILGSSLNLLTNILDNQDKVIFASSGGLTTSIGSSSGNILVKSFEDIVFSNQTRENFVFKNTGDFIIKGDQQSYRILGKGQDLNIQGISPAESINLNLFTNDGDSNDSNYLKIYKSGTPELQSNSEYLQIGWDTSSFVLKSNKNGSGSLQDIKFNNDQIVLSTQGNIEFNQGISNTNTNTNIFNAQIVFNNITNSDGTNGSININGGVNINKKLYISDNLDNNSYTSGAIVSLGDISTHTHINSKNGIKLLNNTEIDLSSENIGSFDQFNVINKKDIRTVFYNDTSENYYNNELKMYTYGKPGLIDTEFLQISSVLTSGNIVFSNKTGSGNVRYMNIKSGQSNVYLETTGNIGINNTDPIYNLDIEGNFNVRGLFNVNLEVTSEIPVKINDLTNSENNTTGALIVAGGVSIQSNANATGLGAGGALTVDGGVSISGDLYIGGTINGIGNNSSTFSYLTLTATEDSTSLTSGALVSFGGITIQTSTNSQSLLNGGSFLTPGGASIGGDLYQGGSFINYKDINLYGTTENLINIYDNFNIKRFSAGGYNNFKIKRYNDIGVFLENTLEISNENGQTIFNNTLSSTSPTSGSVILNGGLTILSTTDSVSLNNGGGISLYGGLSVSKQSIFGGNIKLLSTTDSFDASTGSLVVSGGVGILGHLNVGGNTIINGNLTVNGTTTSVHSANTLLTDNIIILNAGPAGSKDSGFSIERYQIENDTGDGDVVNDVIAEQYTIPDQTGRLVNEIKLPTTSSGINNYYVGWWIKVASGFSTNEVREIIAYNEIDKILIISSPWTSQNPSIGDTVYLYNRSHVGLIFNELEDRFQFGATALSPETTGTLQLTTLLPLEVSRLISQESIQNNGTLLITNTSNATGNTIGGSIITYGGLSVAKSGYIGGDFYVSNNNITPSIDDIIFPQTFIANNNQSIPVNINGVVFDNSWGFDLYLTARVLGIVNYYTNYHIRGINKGTSWDIVKSYVGDAIDINFYVNNSGQLQYTTPNIPDVSSITFKYRCITV